MRPETIKSSPNFDLSNFCKKSFWQEIQKIFRALKILEFNWTCFADAKYNFLLKLVN